MNTDKPQLIVHPQEVQLGDFRSSIGVYPQVSINRDFSSSLGMCNAPGLDKSAPHGTIVKSTEAAIDYYSFGIDNGNMKFNTFITMDNKHRKLCCIPYNNQQIAWFERVSTAIKKYKPCANIYTWNEQLNIFLPTHTQRNEINDIIDIITSKYYL